MIANYVRRFGFSALLVGLADPSAAFQLNKNVTEYEIPPPPGFCQIETPSQAFRSFLEQKRAATIKLAGERLANETVTVLQVRCDDIARWQNGGA